MTDTPLHCQLYRTSQHPLLHPFLHRPKAWLLHMCNVMGIVQVTSWATEKGGTWVSYLFQVSFLSSYVNVDSQEILWLTPCEALPSAHCRSVLCHPRVINVALGHIQLWNSSRVLLAEGELCAAILGWVWSMQENSGWHFLLSISTNWLYALIWSFGKNLIQEVIRLMSAAELPCILNRNELPVCLPDAFGWKARVHGVNKLLSTTAFKFASFKRAQTWNTAVNLGHNLSL